MQTQRQIKICDNCGKEEFQDFRNDKAIDPHGKPFVYRKPFVRWLHVEMAYGGPLWERLTKQGSFDFCNQECLKEWLDK